jgi:hypothetical protein
MYWYRLQIKWDYRRKSATIFESLVLPVESVLQPTQLLLTCRYITVIFLSPRLHVRLHEVIFVITI